MIWRKLIALLLFILWIVLVFFMFLFFFLWFEWTLNINANIDSYNVIIQSEKTTYNLNKKCDTNICSIGWIPIWPINVTIQKENYSSKTYSAVITSWADFNVDVNLSKLSNLILETDTSWPSAKLKVIHSKYKEELDKNQNQIEMLESIITLTNQNNILKITEYKVDKKTLIAEINTQWLDTDNIFFKK